MRRMRRFLRCSQRTGGQRECGQSVVELAVGFPVMIIVAVIAVNALLFLSECAQFDRIARQAVRTYATSPAYGEGSAQASSHIQAAIEASCEKPYLEVRTQVEGAAFGCTTYTATLEFTPTLFGFGLCDEVFGVSLPKMHHSASLTVNTYRPGVFL